MAGYPGVTLVGRLEYCVDASNEFRPGESKDVVVFVPVSSNGMADVEFIFDKVLMDGMDRVQWCFLTRNPDVITASFLRLRPWEMKVTCPVFSCRIGDVCKCGMTVRVEVFEVLLGGEYLSAT